MGKAGAADLDKSLKNGEILPVYLLWGDDGRAIDRAFAAIESAVISGDVAEFNADYFHGKESRAAEIIAAANSLPVMADRRLVALRRADEIKGKDREPLTEYLGSPNPATTLVMTAPGLSVRGPRANKENKSLVKICETAGMAVEFPALKPAELPRAVERELAGKGKKIDRRAAELLVELAGGETLGLFQEMEKVALYVGESEKVTRDDVLAAVADVREAGIFEFTDAIGSRDVESALRSLGRMRERGQEPLMILGMLLRHFRILWKTGQLIEMGETPGAVAKALRLNEWVLKKNYVPQSKKFTPAAAGRVASALAELDIKMKSSRTDRDVLFERVVIDLCLGRLAS